ncbi:response regulator transcription factor [Carboxylicivirga linearis]|uniref:Response regulator transcription factor n=1 Tax=Carboxylicivirga linearis TaxID=1628157 RepID=A0ABS5K0R5_9BACT|nr:response regulator transcription factor [Carboxylicivirga linearis]MBS2100655.1 response regulator transcription factor [Carboxylicivirga linearis]
MSTAKLYLVDDHLIFREGLRNLIEFEGIGTIVGESSDGKHFLENYEGKEPDLVIMDISMPVMDGYEATKLAIHKNPELKVLALSMNGEEEYYYKMIEAGVKGFLLKKSGIKEIERAIHNVINGESYFSNELLRKIIYNIGNPINNSTSSKITLSKREIEVLREICNGLTNEEIAEKLFISALTVKGHRSNLLSKTNCKNSASLVMYAIKNKYVQL